VSELAAALGTIELMNGSIKRAKKLIRQSLIDPTENSVAQARWIAQQLGTNFNEHYLSMRDTYEARAEYAHFQGADPQEIVRQCRRWWEDEPFSSRPAILGSFTATARLFDYELALAFTNSGLEAIPSSIILRNNKVVALAKLGRIGEAREELNRIREKGADFDPVRRATEGLVYFREGNLEAGRRCYNEAIHRALETGDSSVLIRAQAHLLEEELFAGNIGDGGEAVVKLRSEFHKTKDASLIAFWDEFEKKLHLLSQKVVVGR
jgi:tetratricopeptide (TPR) repeat protein